MTCIESAPWESVGPLGKLVEEAEVHYAYVSVRFLGEVMLFWGKLERLDF